VWHGVEKSSVARQALWQYHDVNKQLVRNQLQMDPLVLTVAHAEMHINRFKQQLRNLEEASGQLLVSLYYFTQGKWESV